MNTQFTKHTPGPWAAAKVMIPPKHGAFHVKDADGFDVCVMRMLGEEGEANARLIAALPDMLAALQEIVRNDPYNQSSAGIIARAAIAKATGAATPKYGPNNPPRLRRPGESVKDYRAAMGWPT